MGVAANERPLAQQGVGAVKRLGIGALSFLFSLPILAVPNPTVPLDDFESEPIKWVVKSDERGDRRSPLGLIVRAPVSGDQTRGWCGLFLAGAAQAGETVRFCFPLRGKEIAEKRHSGIAFWLLGDGSAADITVTLVVKEVTGERLFRCPLRLTEGWAMRTFAWNQFTDQEGLSALPFISRVEEIRFERSGPFLPFFFILDDFALLPPAPGPTVIPVRMVVDFQTVSGASLLKWGVNFDADSLALLETPEARRWIARLNLAWARIPATVTAEAPVLEPLLFKIQNWARLVRRLNMSPVINLSPRRPEDLAHGVFEADCRVIVGRLAPLVQIYELFYRLNESPFRMRPEKLVEEFQKLMSAMKRIAPNIQVGGYGESAVWRDRFQSLFLSPVKPDFVSVHFYGTRLISTSDDELMTSARWTVPADLPDQVALRDLSDWLREVYSLSKLPLAVTECALNWQRDMDGKARDNRIQTSVGAAWLASVFCKLAGKTDWLVPYKVAGGGWGLLQNGGQPGPLYWVVLLCQSLFPPGTSLVFSTANYPQLVSLCGVTQTARNILLVNTSPNVLDLQLETLGTLPAKILRMRYLRGTSTPSYQERPPAPMLSLRLMPYDVWTVQFVR